MPVLQQVPANDYVANGSVTSFPYTFQVLNASDLAVYVNGIQVTVGFTLAGIGNAAGGSVTFAVAPMNGSSVRLVRATTVNRTTDYVEGGYVQAETLDTDFDRLVMMVQEVKAGNLVLTGDGRFDAQSRRIKNLADPVLGTDAVNRQWAETGMSSQLAQATAQASSASSSASSAAASATSAAASATAAAQAAGGGVLKASATDSTPRPLDNKLTVTGSLTKTIVNAGFDEQIQLSVNVPVTSVFGRTGNVTLTSTDVTTALGYTPYNPAGNTPWTNATFTPSTKVDVAGSTMTGNLNVSGTGKVILKTTGDITAYRTGGTTGAIFLNQAETKYLYYDGTNFYMSGGSLLVSGELYANGGTRVYRTNEGYLMNAIHGGISSTVVSNGMTTGSISVDAYGRVTSFTPGSQNCNCCS